MGPGTTRIEPIAFEICLDGTWNRDISPFVERWIIDGIKVLGAEFMDGMVQDFQPAVDDYVETVPQVGSYGIATFTFEGDSRTERIPVNASTLAQLATLIRKQFDSIEVRLYRLDDQYDLAEDYIVLAVGPLSDAAGWTRASLQTSEPYFSILNSAGRLVNFIKRACDVCDPAFGHLTTNVLTLQSDHESKLRVFADESIPFMRDYLRGTSSISIWSKEFARQVDSRIVQKVNTFCHVSELVKGGLLIYPRGGGLLAEGERSLLKELVADRLIRAEMFD